MTRGRDYRPYTERCVSCGRAASVQQYGDRCARCTPASTVDGKGREENETMERFGNNTDGWTIPLDETRAVRFVATGDPIVAIPQRYVMIENTPGYLSEDDDPYVSDDFDSVVAYMNERVEEYEDFIAEGGGVPETSRGDRWAYVIDATREHDLGRNFSVNEYEED